MTDLLFSTPWWFPTLILVGGIATFISGNARQHTLMRNSGVGLVVLSIVVVLVSWFVDTDREAVIKDTRQVCAAVEKGDWPGLTSLLDARVALRGPGNLVMYSGREQLVSGTKATTERYGLKSVYILNVNEVVQDISGITVSFTAATTQEFTMLRPVTSRWQFEWQDSGSGWKLTQMTCLGVGDLKADQVQPVFAN